MSTRRQGQIGALVGLVLGTLILGPALLPGYTLHYDLVFVPDLGLSPRTLGTDGSVPRAVPNDVVVALASSVVPGWLVEKVLLLGSLVLAAGGVARLTESRAGAVAAATAVVWNAWVGQRIGIGHWGYLMGYATLPWVLDAARQLTGGEYRRRGAVRTALWLGLAALGGSTAGVLATLVAAVTVLVSGGGVRRLLRSLGIVLGAALLVNAAWWWPFLTAASRSADPLGVRVFATAADTPFGVVGSALLGGAIWNDAMWFSERQAIGGAALGLAVTVVVLLGAVTRRQWWDDPARRGVTAAGVVGLVLALLGAVGPGDRLVAWIVVEVPGAGLLRDGQKFLALLALLLAVAAGFVVDRLVRSGATRVFLVVACLWPVAVLPTLAAGHLGAWGSVSYPREYVDVARLIDDDPDPGSVLVLPWMTYRSYPWNDHRTLLDPWDRLVDRDVVSNDELPVDDVVVAGEDERAQAVGRVLRESGQPDEVVEALRDLGIRWVVVDATQPMPAGTTSELDTSSVVRSEGPLTVHDLGPGLPDGTREGTPPVGLVLSGLGLAVAAAARVWLARDDRSHDGPETS